MKKILLSWIGITDIEAVKKDASSADSIGPLAMAVKACSFQQLFLLSSFSKHDNDSYVSWINQLSPETCINVQKADITNPMNFEEIYLASTKLCELVTQKFGSDASLVYHISPGTSAMTAVFILISKTIYPGEIIRTSIQHGVEPVYIPFDISIDFIPKLIEKQDSHITDTSIEEPAEYSNFQSIVYRSSEMAAVVKLAKKIAPHTLPVLIEGESGTGKELLARAIHNASPRKDQPFLVVNCGAVPHDLFESELFGYEKGAFTGAVSRKFGIFEAAGRGTVFLDEIGELSLQQQVKLLRVIQEKTIRRIGGTEEIPVEMRIIAATNKNLIQEMQQRTFREDLFYRIAAAIITLPPLRDRRGDISLLIDYFLERIQTEYSNTPGLRMKHEPNQSNNDAKMISNLNDDSISLSAEARQILYMYDWPGNIRELINTLRRAYIWSAAKTIQADDISKSMIQRTVQETNQTDNQQNSRKYIGGIQRSSTTENTSADNYKMMIENHEFSFEHELHSTVRGWIHAALDISRGNKTQAAELLGLNNYQTLTNWMKRTGLAD